VNKLVPCAWLLSGALDVWSLRLRLRLRITTCDSDLRSHTLAMLKMLTHSSV